MSASYVAGTAPGRGSANGQFRGSNNGRNLYQPLTGPHVVAAGEVTLAAGVATVVFPTPLPLAASYYVVMLTSRGTANTSETTVTAKTDVSSKFASFAIAGDTTDVIGYTVIRTGNL